MSLELSGTTGVKGVAGSVSAPSIVGDDTNTGISFPAADTIKFSTGGVERMSITNSGVSGITQGKILQVIQVEKTDTFSSNSDTFVDLTGLSATITPSATSSKVLVIASLVFGGSNDAYGAGQLVRGSTVLGLAPAAGSRTQSTFTLNGEGDTNQHKLQNLGFTYLDSPSTTSATTYKLQGRTYTGDNRYFTINRSHLDGDNGYNQRGTSRILLMEVAA